MKDDPFSMIMKAVTTLRVCCM